MCAYKRRRHKLYYCVCICVSVAWVDTMGKYHFFCCVLMEMVWRGGVYDDAGWATTSSGRLGWITSGWSVQSHHEHMLCGEVLVTQWWLLFQSDTAWLKETQKVITILIYKPVEARTAHTETFWFGLMRQIHSTTYHATTHLITSNRILSHREIQWDSSLCVCVRNG